MSFRTIADSLTCFFDSHEDVLDSAPGAVLLHMPAVFYVGRRVTSLMNMNTARFLSLTSGVVSRLHYAYRFNRSGD